MGNCQTIRHTPHSPTYPVDEGNKVWIQSIVWCQCKNLEFGRLKLGIKNAIKTIASGKLDVTRVTLHKCHIGFVFWSDGRSCSLSVAQWSAQQNPTAEAPVRPPGRQNTHPPIFPISWTPCWRPMIREVECLIRLYEVWAGLGVLSTGGWVPMAWSKVFSGPAGVRPNMFGGRNNCLQQSGYCSELSPQKSWFDYPEESNTGSKADSHLAIRDRFPGGETYQLWYCEPLVKKQWGQTLNV